MSERMQEMIIENLGKRLGVKVERHIENGATWRIEDEGVRLMNGKALILVVRKETINKLLGGVQ